VKLGVTWKSRILPYDPKTTPCWTGKIPDTFWRRKGAVRGSNPTHSLSAIGQRADELVQGWKKLLELDGYILLLGVDLSCCSSIHLAEERVQLPQHILEKLKPPQELIEKYGTNLGWPEWDIGYGPYPDFAKMEGPCKEGGIMRIIGIGESTVRLARLRSLIELYAEALRENPDIFYS
jgi:aminoglycoside 3-N-acetyltransferase